MWVLVQSLNGWITDALQLGTNLSLSEDANSAYLSANAYNSSTGWKRVNNQLAGYIRMGTNDGTFSFSNAVTGAADSAITWQERIHVNASGAVAVTADTTSDWALAVTNGTNSNAFGLYVNAPSTSGIPLRVDGGGSERMRILSTGGITFNGDTAQANALDDYEEGTWTPTLNSGSFSSHVATYTKVGSLVQLTLDATVGTGGGSQLTIPFACANTAGMAVYTSGQDFAAGRTQVNGVIASTLLYFRVTGDNIIYAAQVLTAGATIHASFTYRTDQ